MRPDRWWKTFSHASQIAIHPDSIRWNVRVATRWRCDFAPGSMLFGCPAGVHLVAKDGLPQQNNRENLVFLRSQSPRIRCNRQPVSLTLVLLFSDSSICPYRFQNRPCRRVAKFAGWARSGSGSCPESDCGRSSTSTSVTPAIRSPLSSQIGWRKRPAAARRQRGRPKHQSRWIAPKNAIPRVRPGFFLAMPHV